MPKTPLEFIANDPHVISVLPGEDWHLPDLNIGAFHDGSHEAVQRAVNTVQGFVRSPYVLDRFADHNERRRWLADLTARFGDHVEQWINSNNCLRYGRISKITFPDGVLGLHLVKNYKGPRREGLEEAVGKVTGLDLGHRRVYDQKSLMEKVRYVMDVKRRVHDVLYWV